jgi:hypothetical protein
MTAPNVRARLRPVEPADYPWLLPLAQEMALVGRWRTYGVTPSPDEQVRLLWQNVLCHFVVESHDQVRIAVVTCYQADLRNGHAFIAVLADPRVRHPLVLRDGMLLFLDHLFGNFPFRKLYAEASETTIGDFSSAFGKVVEVEGRLVDHLLWQGRYLDWYYLSIRRDRWLEVQARRQGNRGGADDRTAKDGDAT